MRLQRLLGFAVVAVIAFGGGLLLPRLSRRVPLQPGPAPVSGSVSASTARPAPQQLLRTFQGVRNASRYDERSSDDEWIVLQVRSIADEGPLHGFDYVLSSAAGTEHGRGSFSLPDGVVRLGTLKGEARVRADGIIEMRSRLIDGPPYWRIASRRATGQAP